VRSLRILIVDDNDLNVQLATFVLAESGMTVESAAAASHALARTATFRPDLILMEIQMRDMDGLELAPRLMADPVTTRVRLDMAQAGPCADVQNPLRSASNMTADRATVNNPGLVRAGSPPARAGAALGFERSGGIDVLAALLSAGALAERVLG
jgi:CheY-like chemotaxis protein